MYSILSTNAYKRSLKKVSKWKNFDLDALNEVIDMLAAGSRLPASCRDHSLVGNLKGFKECHIKGDMLLIYKAEKEELILILSDIGDHHSLFGM